MLSSVTRSALRRTAVPTVGAVRNLNVHEYVSMELLEHYGVTVPKAYVASTAEEAENLFLHSLNKRKNAVVASDPARSMTLNMTWHHSPSLFFL
jgi:hypothetical protein